MVQSQWFDIRKFISIAVLHVLFPLRSRMKKQPPLDTALLTSERKEQKYNLTVTLKASAWKQPIQRPKPVT